MKNNIHTFVILAYKKSKYLEECLKSVINQKYHSNVIIATTTDNSYIRSLAKKYKLNVIVGKHSSIGGDFDFAITCAKTKLVTIAHQDDIYDYEYSKKVIDAYYKYHNSLIIFTDYYEIRNNKKVYSNTNLRIKRILLLPLRIKFLSKYKFIKRLVISMGDAISCPTVTFNKDNISNKIFTSNYQSNVDWDAWEKISHGKGNFIYIKDKLVGHRISKSTTTSNIIKQGIRTREDYEMFLRFWPSWIAKILTKVYRNSEKSNDVNEE